MNFRKLFVSATVHYFVISSDSQKIQLRVKHILTDYINFLFLLTLNFLPVSKLTLTPGNMLKALYPIQCSSGAHIVLTCMTERGKLVTTKHISSLSTCVQA